MSSNVTLMSSDGKSFEVDSAVACQSETLRHMIEDDGPNGVFPLPNVTSQILSKVIEYCKRHVAAADNSNDPNLDEELKSFDRDFVKVDHPEELFELILAANYLNIKSLLDFTCQATADMIKDYSIEKVRMTFNIENDFTPQEEEEIRKEHQWAFQ